MHPSTTPHTLFIVDEEGQEQELLVEDFGVENMQKSRFFFGRLPTLKFPPVLQNLSTTKRKKRNAWMNLMCILIFAVALDILVRVFTDDSSNCLVDNNDGDQWSDPLFDGFYGERPILLIGDSAIAVWNLSFCD